MISSHLFYFFSGWNNFYEGTSPPFLILTNNQNYRYSSDEGNIYFQNIIFQEITYSSQGGAIYISFEGSNHVLIEGTIFGKCQSSSEGGAVYFSNYGSCVFSKICVYDCNTGGEQYGQFCYCQTQTNNNYFLSFKLSSILSCINSLSGNSGQTILFSYGNHSILQTNISNNICRYQPSFSLEYLKISYSQFSTFENNLANRGVCLRWYDSNPVTTSFVENCNIINNSQLENDRGILSYEYHNLNINNCSFIKNRENQIVPLFYGEESSCYLILNECYTDDTSNNGNSFQITNPISNIFTNINYFINTEKCINEFEYSSIITYSSTKFICKSYTKYQNIPRNRCKIQYISSILMLVIIICDNFTFLPHISVHIHTKF
jgi:hypothetical protein